MAVTCHEVRNPLNGTVAYLQFAMAILADLRGCSPQVASARAASKQRAESAGGEQDAIETTDEISAHKWSQGEHEEIRAAAGADNGSADVSQRQNALDLKPSAVADASKSIKVDGTEDEVPTEAAKDLKREATGQPGEVGEAGVNTSIPPPFALSHTTAAEPPRRDAGAPQRDEGAHNGRSSLDMADAGAVTSISSFVDGAEAERAPEELDTMVAGAFACTRIALLVVENLSTLEKLRQGLLELHVKPERLSDVLSDVVTVLKPQLSHTSEVELRTTVSPTLENNLFACDRKLLVQAHTHARPCLAKGQSLVSPRLPCKPPLLFSHTCALLNLLSSPRNLQL
eukprot:6196948-Pleurochrysis_carterae.AAC.2